MTLPSYTSFECSGREALFLFQLMNIPEAEQLLRDLNNPSLEGEQAEGMYKQVVNRLVKDSVIEVEDGQVTIDRQVHNLLMGCKLSIAVIRLELHIVDGESSVTYGFLSGMQIVEWVWMPARDQAVLSSFKELQDLFQLMGNRIELPDTAEEMLRTAIQAETLQQLFALPIGSDVESTQSILQQDHHLNESLINELSHAFVTILRQGQFDVYTRGTEGKPQTIYFLGSTGGNWLFLEGKDTDLTAFKVTEEEVVQSLFLLTTRSLSMLPLV
ncbi:MULTISPECIES: hypothetical protein [Paenibacillus]|uniref:ESAT-6 protein secretion system EspG family protein n=1 Tax=Paenibacillus pabuli TaxID=1472 RepID=A0A855XSY8_9BACL|nr:MULTISPECIES: hypothetical protein [Paenibacillus]PWW35066.1 hypothetical protein DET56_11370 [Paenibacillus pabuli]PXW01824.1 hypothetical protein DEU73_11269 [Paenibacillus taichungensis]